MTTGYLNLGQTQLRISLIRSSPSESKSCGSVSTAAAPIPGEPCQSASQGLKTNTPAANYSNWLNGPWGKAGMSDYIPDHLKYERIKALESERDSLRSRVAALEETLRFFRRIAEPGGEINAPWLVRHIDKALADDDAAQGGA